MDISNLKKLVEKTQDKESSRRNGGSRTSTEYENALVKVDDINYVQEVNQKIKDMGFETYTLTDMLESMQKQYAGLMAVLGGIGGVSLFVAALGITNTMVMSIYERTREIGVIKVLGANIADIRRLFLFEAALIGFFGGIVGVILSYGVSYLMNKVGVNILGYYGGDSNMSVIPLWLSGFALLFSVLIGLISGYYPARRAMKLSALEAIRTE
jgi:ABC-type antimicrobial peptide transport system permease subunit